MNSIETKRSLTLAELGHDGDRDRPTHILQAGYDDSVAQHARCGTLVQPPFRPRFGPRDSNMCVVCLAVSAWLHGASDRDCVEWLERHLRESGSSDRDYVEWLERHERHLRESAD